MEEARYSFNVKCVFHGFECCFTLREDQPGKAADLVDKSLQVINYLVTKGALPLKQGATVIKTAADIQSPSTPAPAAPAAAEVTKVAKKGVSVDPPVCKSCNSSANMELIEFNKDGRMKQAWKCQTCNKWAR
jgi:hypothetical protein